jgi:SAM-dependent methyltransferase
MSNPPVKPSSAPNMFDRCGIATMEDLEQPIYQQVFQELEAIQAKFLAEQAKFRSRRYRWPKDALHNWSRIWEYPYVYQQLRRYAQENRGQKLLAADIGSGVTFMPFAAANLGYEVCCVDTDPIVGIDLPKAVDALGYQQTQIYHRATDGQKLPLADQSVDCLFCISVLEHVPDPCVLVSEFRRVLKPKGLLLLTIDLALNRYAQITPPNHRRLMETLQQEFQFVLPYGSQHPGAALTNRNGKYRLFPWSLEPRRILTRSYLTFWKTLGQDREPLLSCEGMVMKPHRKAA